MVKAILNPVSLSILFVVAVIVGVDGQERAQYQLLFDWDVIGCSHANSNTTTIATLTVYLRYLFFQNSYITNHLLYVTCQNTTLTFDFEAPDPLGNDFAPAFEWYNTPRFFHNDTCCWSVSNVRIMKKPSGETWDINVCNEQSQTAYQYNEKTWICPSAGGNNGPSRIQIASDVGIITAGLDGVLAEIDTVCTVAEEPILIKYRDIFADELPCVSPAMRTILFINTMNEILRSPVDGLQILSGIVYEFSFIQVVSLLDTALETPIDDSRMQEFNLLFLNITNALVSRYSMNSDTDTLRSAVIQLLLLLDQYSLNFVEPTGSLIETENFFLRVLEVDEVPSNDLIALQVNNNSIFLPPQIFNHSTVVRVSSFLFPNLSHLIPPVDSNSSIISPIISSTTDCSSCPVTDLAQNVTIQLEIDERFADTSDIISCVFLEYEKEDDNLLPTGDWSSSGCTTTSINGNLVTCSCNHLTHFAILLSPKGPEISPLHFKVLSTIGLVLVPISLLCMVMVILTFSLIRSLWNIRNYVHIMLCVSLFIAQLVFIIGVDKIKNQDACSAVAVLLLYLFLVTFMWMLMEGVVLYVTLVKVFVSDPKYYIIAFTVASYVVPFVYLMLIVPIGYLVNTDEIADHTHFLYYHEKDKILTACWLNYSTGFVWSFIAPVIIIILINIGFFIMALVIAKRHSSKQATSVEIRHWILVTISLTVVMGIAWLVGVLAFRRELLPVVYITAIFIAAQGLILFIILVPFNKPVRKAFSEIWTKQKKNVSSKLFDSSFKSKVSTLKTGSSASNTLTSESSRNGDTVERGSSLTRGLLFSKFSSKKK